VSAPKCRTILLAVFGPTPRINPEPRYFSSRGRRRLALGRLDRLELLTLLAMRFPIPAEVDARAGEDLGLMERHRDPRVGSVEGRDLKHRPAGLGAVKGDPLDDAPELLAGSGRSSAGVHAIRSPGGTGLGGFRLPRSPRRIAGGAHGVCLRATRGEEDGYGPVPPAFRLIRNSGGNPSRCRCSSGTGRLDRVSAGSIPRVRFSSSRLHTKCLYLRLP
jgi:hypothetical protein